MMPVSPMHAYQPVVKVPAAFERRCIPPDRVVRRLHMPDMRPPHAGYRVSGRLAALGATRGITAGCCGLALLARMAPDPIRDGDARFRSPGPRPVTTTAISRTIFALFLLLAPAVTTAQTAASLATSPLPRSHTGVTEVVSVPCRFDPLIFNVPPFFYVPDSVYGWKEGIILLESNCGRYWIHIEGEVAGAGILERDVGYIAVNQEGTPSLRSPHIELSNHNTNSNVTKTRRYILDFCPRDEIEYSFQCGPSTVDPAERSTLTVNWLPNRPDLIVRSPTVDKNNLTAEETFTFSASVYNQGHNEALSVTLEYYQSRDPLISQDDDTHLGSDYVGTLEQARSSNRSTVLTAPRERRHLLIRGMCTHHHLRRRPLQQLFHRSAGGRFGSGAGSRRRPSDSQRRLASSGSRLQVVHHSSQPGYRSSRTDDSGLLSLNRYGYLPGETTRSSERPTYTPSSAPGNRTGSCTPPHRRTRAPTTTTPASLRLPARWTRRTTARRRRYRLS